MDSRDCLEIRALQENLENQETKVFLENLVLWVKLDQGVSVEFLEREENWVQLACRGRRVFLVLLVQMDQRVAPVLLVHLVMWDPQVFRACQERGASLGHLGLKATEEQLVRKDLKVHLEMMAQGVPQVPLAH